MTRIKIRVEDCLKPLIKDEEFRRKVIKAYYNQVEANGGWGFTVKHQGYSVRFDIDDKLSKGNCVVYVGYAEEKPMGVQKTLFEVLA